MAIMLIVMVAQHHDADGDVADDDVPGEGGDDDDDNAGDGHEIAVT